jgi:hypothetical protein
MTIKQRIIELLKRQPMTAREASDYLRLDTRLIQQLVYELREALIPSGRKRIGRRGPQSIVWSVK